MTIHNRIAGTFRLISPLHVASPDKSLAKTDNETPTVQRRILTSKGQSSIPYFPSNDFRGRLRRKAAERLMEFLAATDKFSPALYAGLTCGSNSAKPDSAPLTVEEVLRAKDNVFMGLFGSGARMLESRYTVNDLIPILSETIDIGAVPSAFGETEFETFLPVRKDGQAIEGWQLTESTQFLRVDDIHRVKNIENIMAYIDDATNVIGRMQVATIESRAKRKESKEKAASGEIKSSDVSGKEDVGNIASFQAIMAGTPMYFQLDFHDSVSDGHVGLMLLALQDLVQEQRLGGWCRAGLGRFNATLTLTRDGESMPVFSTPNASDAAQLSDATKIFTGAANAGINACTVPGMLEFFTNRPVKEKSAKKAEGEES